MSLWRIAWRSIEQRSLSSILTAFSLALGVALVISVLVVRDVIEESFTRSAQGYHLIVGKSGDKMQLVFNTVFHLSDPPFPIPYSVYKEFKEGKYAPAVAAAIPYCLGDNYQGYRVVGTVPELFTELHYASGKSYAFTDGRNFEPDGYFEAVIGATAAAKTGLKVGDAFEPTHGVTEEGETHKHDAFEIVGVLEATGTANDRAIFINIEGFYLLPKHALLPEDEENHPPAKKDDHDKEHDHEHDAEHAKSEKNHKHDEKEHDHEHDKDQDKKAGVSKKDDHDHDHDKDHAEGEKNHKHDEKEDHEHGKKAAHKHDHDHDHDHDHAHEPLPESQREVTSILILAKNDLEAMTMNRSINKTKDLQAVSPIREITSFFGTIIGPIQILLVVLCVLIVVVAGVGIMVSIYNSMSSRQQEIAVMRALGAGRSQIMLIILLESILLALAGGAAGFLLGHGLIGLLSPYINNQIGVFIGFWRLGHYEWILLPGLILLASLVGYVPAMTAYRTDVSKALTASP